MKWTSAEMRELAEHYRERIIEALAEIDEDIMEKYLENREISEEDIYKALRQATINNNFVPVLCGTSYRNKGAAAARCRCSLSSFTIGCSPNAGY